MATSAEGAEAAERIFATAEPIIGLLASARGQVPPLEGLDTDGLLRVLIQEVHAQTWELRALTNLLHDAIVGEMIEP